MIKHPKKQPRVYKGYTKGAKRGIEEETKGKETKKKKNYPLATSPHLQPIHIKKLSKELDVTTVYNLV